LGFDGLRKGFVLGGGLGFSPVAKWSVDESIPGFGTLKGDESKTGVGAQLLIGYAWDESNMIVWESNVTAYESEDWDETLGQGIGGASWYHYFGLPGKSAFTTVGLGVYIWDNSVLSDLEEIDPGFGLLFGGGYEFARHWQVGGYLSFGKTSWVILDFEHVHFNILVSGVAF